MLADWYHYRYLFYFVTRIVNNIWKPGLWHFNSCFGAFNYRQNNHEKALFTSYRQFGKNAVGPHFSSNLTHQYLFVFFFNNDRKYICEMGDPRGHIGHIRGIAAAIYQNYPNATVTNWLANRQ
jgi:hypothetical protein